MNESFLREFVEEYIKKCTFHGWTENKGNFITKNLFFVLTFMTILIGIMAYSMFSSNLFKLLIFYVVSNVVVVVCIIRYTWNQLKKKDPDIFQTNRYIKILNLENKLVYDIDAALVDVFNENKKAIYHQFIEGLDMEKLEVISDYIKSEKSKLEKQRLKEINISILIALFGLFVSVVSPNENTVTILAVLLLSGYFVLLCCLFYKFCKKLFNFNTVMKMRQYEEIDEFLSNAKITGI